MNESESDSDLGGISDNEESLSPEKKGDKICTVYQNNDPPKDGVTSYSVHLSFNENGQLASMTKKKTIISEENIQFQIQDDIPEQHEIPSSIELDHKEYKIFDCFSPTLISNLQVLGQCDLSPKEKSASIILTALHDGWSISTKKTDFTKNGVWHYICPINGCPAKLDFHFDKYTEKLTLRESQPFHTHMKDNNVKGRLYPDQRQSLVQAISHQASQVQLHSMIPDTMTPSQLSKIKTKVQDGMEITMLEELMNKTSLDVHVEQTTDNQLLRWVVINMNIAGMVNPTTIATCDATACIHRSRKLLEAMLIADPDKGYQILAYGALRKNTEEDYAMFFRQVSKKVEQPYAIVVDRCAAQIKALKRIWKGIHIVWCRRHLLASCAKNCPHFYRQIYKFVHLLITEEEFMQSVNSLKEDGKEWQYVNDLIKDKECWFPSILIPLGLYEFRTSNPSEGLFGNFKAAIENFPAVWGVIIKELDYVSKSRYQKMIRRILIPPASLTLNWNTIEQFEAMINPQSVNNSNDQSKNNDNNNDHDNDGRFISLKIKDVIGMSGIKYLADACCEFLNEMRAQKNDDQSYQNKTCIQCVVRQKNPRMAFPCFHMIKQRLGDKGTITPEDFPLWSRRRNEHPILITRIERNVIPNPNPNQGQTFTQAYIINEVFSILDKYELGSLKPFWENFVEHIHSCRKKPGKLPIARRKVLSQPRSERDQNHTKKRKTSSKRIRDSHKIHVQKE